MANEKWQIGTSRINYRKKQNQQVLNITIGSGYGAGKLYAPTWEMVNASKEGSISWNEYKRQYVGLMKQRYFTNKRLFLSIFNSKEIILCCYCKDTHLTTRHCHRYILVDIFSMLARLKGIEFEYTGEHKSAKKS